MNSCELNTAEEMHAELKCLHERFPFVPDDLETCKSGEMFNKIEEVKSWKEKHLRTCAYDVQLDNSESCECAWCTLPFY